VETQARYIFISLELFAPDALCGSAPSSEAGRYAFRVSIGACIGIDQAVSKVCVMTDSDDATAVVVLVVEDETLIRLLANDMLSEAGYRVLEARDGQEALTILEVHADVRALFTDVTMPNLDGLSLAKIVSVRAEAPASLSEWGANSGWTVSFQALRNPRARCFQAEA
jgi:hypothetical protein